MAKTRKEKIEVLMTMKVHRDQMIIVCAIGMVAMLTFVLLANLIIGMIVGGE